jgi:hypothetical protein
MSLNGPPTAEACGTGTLPRCTTSSTTLKQSTRPAKKAAMIRMRRDVCAVIVQVPLYG